MAGRLFGSNDLFAIFGRICGSSLQVHVGSVFQYCSSGVEMDRGYACSVCVSIFVYFRYITQEKSVVSACIFGPNFKHDSKCKYSVFLLHLWQAALTESEKFAETAESEVIFVFFLGGWSSVLAVV